MKTLLRLILLCALLTLGLAACSSSSENTKDEQQREALTEGDDVEAEDKAAQTEKAAAEETRADSDKVPVGDSPILGPDLAPVTIVEFADYQCPFCKKAHQTMEAIRDEYGEDVRIVYKHNPLPFHKQAEAASRAAIAAGEQGKFAQMHEVLFRYQKVMKGKTDAEMKDWTAGFAGEMGLDVEQFKADFDAESTTRQIEEDKKLASELNARGTPHFLINGKRLRGAQPKARFDTLIKEELAAAKEARKSGMEPTEFYAARVKKNYEKRAKPEPKPRKPKTKVSYVPIDQADPMTGATDDPLVTVVVFSDFQCPFCAKVVPTVEQIEKDYGAKVRIVFKQLPLPFHKQAEMAAEIALAAQEQGKFWEMHDLLFDRQREMRRKTDEEMVVWGVELAKELGLDTSEFAERVENRAHKKEIESESKLANRVGARGTPNFWINGYNVVGAQPYPNFKRVIDEQLEIAENLKEEKGLSGEALYKAAAEHNEDKAPAAEEPTRRKRPAKQVDVSELTIDSDQVMNADDYDVTVFAFSDYQCPFCSRGHDNLMDAVSKTDAKVRIIFKHYPLPFHKQAKDAAHAAMAAGEQGKFWEMSEHLFDNQKRLREDDVYVDLAKELGLDVAKFKADIKKNKSGYKKQVEEDMKQGQKVGVRGTPAFYIDGERVVGAQPTQTFVDVIEKKAKAND